MGILEELKKKGASKEEISVVADSILNKLKTSGASSQEIKVVSD